MEQLIVQMPHLKHLQLKTNGRNNIFNGFRWRILTRSLITFKFEFRSKYMLTKNVLASFSTSFWIKEKHWFVAYQDYCLFSIPHCAPEHIDISQRTIFHSTKFDKPLVYDNVNRITVTHDIATQDYYFSNVKILHIKCSISIGTISSIINLNKIKHLIIKSIDDLGNFTPLQFTMPHLSFLTVEGNITVKMIQNIRRYCFPQIHKLEIKIDNLHCEYIIEELFHLFPCTKYLIYKSPIQSIRTMVHFIDGFKYLLNASFYTKASFCNREKRLFQNPTKIVEYSSRLTKQNFQCQIYHSTLNNSLFDIDCWIDAQVSHCFAIILSSDFGCVLVFG